MPYTSSIWKHFEKIADSPFTALCKLCEKTYSYKTSTTNLKKHLLVKHNRVYNSLSNENNFKNLEVSERPKQHRPSFLWKFYKKKPNDAHVALCLLCNEEYSFRTSVTNLKTHLRRRHKIAYKELLNRKQYAAEESGNRFKGTMTNLSSHLKRHHEDAVQTIKVTASKEAGDISFDSDDEDPILQQDVYFEEENDQIKCTVCGKVISEDGQDPREHLEEHHPGLLARIIKNEDRAEEEEEVDEEDDKADEKDIFTEVVYLDDVPTPQTKKRKSQTINQTIEKKTRKLSTNSEEYVIKSKKATEIDTFTNYIKILLEKMPQDLCSRLQLEIISLIMSAQLKLPSSTVSRGTSTSVNNEQDD